MFIGRIAGVAALSLVINTTAFVQSSNAGSSGQQAQAGATGTMKLVGCLVKEADYRKAHGLGNSALGNAGLGDEFVLVDATVVQATGGNDTSANAPSGAIAATPSASGEACIEKGRGQAYRLAGKAEDELKPFVGHRMENKGGFENVRDARIANGETNAKMPAEITVQSYREAPAAVATTAAAAPTPTDPPAPVVQAPATAVPALAPSPETIVPSPVGTSGSEPTLPSTASDTPLVAAIALLCLSASLGLTLIRVARKTPTM